jgi:hypothetical protein
MASPNSTFTEMVTTTLRNHSRDVVDNVTEHNALLRFLKRRGNIRTKSGGYEIAFPLEYAENSTYQRYSGYDELSVQASDVLSAAKYDWAQIAIHVTASGRELRMNNSSEQMIDLVKARVKNAKNTASNNLSIDLYSDGALTNQIGGLSHILQTNGEGTVGGINSANFTFWKNTVYEIPSSNAWTSSNIKGYFNTLWLSLQRGDDAPDLIVLSHDFFAAFEAGEQENQRYMKSELADAGFNTLKYKGRDVIFDSNSNFGTTAERGYFLNTKYLYLVQHSEAQWTQDEERTPVNQDAIVIPMYWMGQLVCTNRALQGLLIDAA